MLPPSTGPASRFFLAALLILLAVVVGVITLT